MKEIKVSHSNIEVTDGMKAHLEKELDRVFEHFSEYVEQANISLESARGSISVSITLLCRSKMQFKTIIERQSGKDFYALTSDVAKKAERQVRKFKERTQKKMKANQQM